MMNLSGADMQMQEMQDRLEAMRQRAEAAEARVRELEIQRAATPWGDLATVLQAAPPNAATRQAIMHVRDWLKASSA